jgi:hypothetical protein
LYDFLGVDVNHNAEEQTEEELKIIRIRIRILKDSIETMFRPVICQFLSSAIYQH